MRCTPDADVLLDPPCDAAVLRAQLSLHEGTAGPCVAPYLDFPYEADAIVPAGACRALRPSEFARLVAPARGAGTICLVRLPERLYMALRAALRPLDDCRDEREFGSRLRGRALGMALKSLGGAVSGWAQLDTEFHCRISRAGLPTVTDRDGQLIGLHVDRWYRNGPLRNDPPARMCLNVGTQSRSFFCVDRRLAALQGALAGRDRVPVEGTGLARQLLSRVPTRGVLRLRIPPGWGYIAPTEELVHDGSTHDMSAWDVVAYAHGRFNLAAIPDSWLV